jgi:predicted  nucleic acid-binding Zn-ribbon protein
MTAPTPKARPFPANQEYSPTVRQYLNRLSKVEAVNDTQFSAITSRLGQLEQDTEGLIAAVGEIEEDLTTLQGDVSGALVAIDSLQQLTADHTVAIDLLNFRYDTARVDLDGALAAIQVLATDLDLTEATVAVHTLGLADLQAAVAALDQQDNLTEATLTALDDRVTGTENRLTDAERDIQALQYADIDLDQRISNAQVRLDYVIEAQGLPFSGYRLPLADAVVGTVAKVVGVVLLPVGDYAAPSAYLGCPTTPAFTAILTLVTAADGAALATVEGPGTMAWQTASAGFTLANEASVEVHLVGSSAPAVALIKGLLLTIDN